MIRMGIFLTIALSVFLPTLATVGLIGVLGTCFVMKLILEEKFKFEFNVMDVYIFLFGCILAYSTATSYLPKKSLLVFILYFSFLFFYFIVVNTIKTKEQLYIVAVAFVGSGLLVAIYGILQHFGIVDMSSTLAESNWVDPKMFEDIKLRVISVFNNPNVLGEYLILIIPISISLLWGKKSWGYRIVYLGITAILLICLAFTYSRGSWLGLVLALGLFVILKDKRFIPLAVIGVLLLPFVLPTSMIERFSSIGNIKDSSSAYRIGIWLGALDMLKEHWMIGIGIGTDVFKEIYSYYAYGYAYALHSHNTYLQILLETGIVGFSLFIFIIIKYYRSMITMIVKTKKGFTNTFMIALCSGLFGFLFQGFVDNTFYNYKLVFIFWTIIAVGMASVNIAKNE